MTVRQAVASILFSFLMALLFVVASCRPAAAQMDRSTKLFIALVPVYTWQSFVDAAGTADCVEAHRCVEVNPVWVAVARTDGIRHSMRVKFVAQTALTVGVAVAMKKWPNQRRTLVIGYALMTAAQIAVNVHNAQVINR